jgi:predicted metal-dependent enzyme (double-stranded beta helix superfamily)
MPQGTKANRDWLVTESGHCQPCATPREWDLLETPYHFYRFLTETEDALKESTTVEQCECLPTLRYLVRKLMVNAYWLRAFSEGAAPTQSPEVNFPTASPSIPSSSLPISQSSGTTLLNLYDEVGYPLTVQLETHLPGTISPIHCHGTWGIVAILQGQERNILWKRQPESASSDKIVRVDEKTLNYGDIISFVPAAIHSIESVGPEPLITFNLYGETNLKQRFEFDLITDTAKRY